MAVPTGSEPSPAYTIALELAELTDAPIEYFSTPDKVTSKHRSDCIS
jgi:hypothetical protein